MPISSSYPDFNSSSSPFSSLANIKASTIQVFYGLNKLAHGLWAGSKSLMQVFTPSFSETRATFDNIRLWRCIYGLLSSLLILASEESESELKCTLPVVVSSPKGAKEKHYIRHKWRYKVREQTVIVSKHVSTSWWVACHESVGLTSGVSDCGGNQ